MTRPFLALLLAFLPLTATAGDITLPLTARGNEPFWRIEAAGSTLRLTEPEGKGTVQDLPFTQSTDGAALVLTTTDFTLRLTRALCHDDMTGLPYPLSATFTRKGQPANGCAGNPADLLTGDWTAATLNGAPLPAEAEVTLSFTDGTVAGKSGCNRYSGPATLTGEGLSLGPLAATRMACPAPLMDTEQTTLAALARVTAFDIAPDGTLLLTDGTTPLLTATR